MSIQDINKVSSFKEDGPSYESDEDNLNKDQLLFLSLKKNILLSKYKEQIQNINDEYILDEYIIKWKDNLNWDDFLSSLLLKYNIKALYKKVKSKVKAMLTINYSQIFQIKQYYDKLYIEKIYNYLPEKYKFVISLTFVSYAYDSPFDINSQGDISKVLDSYLNLSVEKIVELSGQVEDYKVNIGRNIIIVKSKEDISVYDKHFLTTLYQSVHKGEPPLDNIYDFVKEKHLDKSEFKETKI